MYVSCAVEGLQDFLVGCVLPARQVVLVDMSYGGCSFCWCRVSLCGVGSRGLISASDRHVFSCFVIICCELEVWNKLMDNVSVHSFLVPLIN